MECAVSRPGSKDGCLEAGLEALEGLVAHGEDGTDVARVLQLAGDELEAGVAEAFVRTGEHVDAFLVTQDGVFVETVAGNANDGFGHEIGLQAILVGQQAGKPHAANHIVCVLQRRLELYAKVKC